MSRKDLELFLKTMETIPLWVLWNTRKTIASIVFNSHHLLQLFLTDSGFLEYKIINRQKRRSKDQPRFNFFFFEASTIYIYFQQTTGFSSGDDLTLSKFTIGECRKRKHFIPKNSYVSLMIISLAWISGRKECSLMVISQSCFVSSLHLMEALSFSRNLPRKKYVDCWDFNRVQICEK